MRSLPVFVAALLTACGGGAPSAPSRPPAPTPPPPLVVRDGWTEQPVQAEVTPANPSIGTVATVRAPGFLVRDAPFKGEPFYLWGQEPEYVRALVYHEFAPGSTLTRWTRGFSIVDPGFGADVSAVLAHAAAEASRVSGLPISLATTGEVQIAVDPNDPYMGPGVGALTYNRFGPATIVGARIVFRSHEHITGRGRRYDNLALHEVGHVLGLGHSIDPSDVMRRETDRVDVMEFSERERLALRLMYRWRRPGNVFPDSEPRFSVLAAPERTMVIVD